jgi:hypothetical protein
VVVGFYSAVVLIMSAAVAGAALNRWTLPALLSLVFTLILCLVAVKHGMGGNQLEQALALLAVVLWFVSQFLLISKVRFARHKSWGIFGLVTALTALLLMVVVATGINFPIRSPKDSLAEMRRNASQLVSLLQGNSTDRWDEMLAKAHLFYKPLNIFDNKTIDVYPQHTALVIGREGLRYTPRPAFLSLNAHTFDLAILNASHLQGSKAPDFILFQVQSNSTNNRHPALADGPSWPLLLAEYSLENTDDKFLLLEKRKQPLHIDRKLLLDVKLQQGETLILPQGTDNLLWAEVEVKRSLFGNIVHALYKSPHVVLESRTANDKIFVFQIVPELGKAGFLMSPLVQDNSAFAELYLGSGISGNIVQSIAISSPEAPDYFWKNEIRLRLWSLRIDK